MRLKSLFTLLNRAYKDLRFPNRFGVSVNLLDPHRLPYGLDYSATGMQEAYGMEFDRNGIIMMPHYYDHLERYTVESTHYYSPVKIAHYAVASYNDWLKTGDRKSRDGCLNHAGYLIDHSESFQNCAVWKTPTSSPKYELAPDYISAIVQGLVVSALVRGHKLCGTGRYLKKAKDAIGILHIPVEKGGLLAKSKYGVVYEEYPCIPHSHVVNGFMFCLMGIYDLYVVTEEAQYMEMFNEGVSTLHNIIPDWLERDWATYDLRHITGQKRKNYATRHYQFLHVDQLTILSEYSKKQGLLDAAKKIESQVLSRRATARMYVKKYAYLSSI